MRISRVGIALALLAVGTAGCGGSGGSSSLPAARQSAPDKSSSAATVAVTLTIPAAVAPTAKGRRPRYVSFGTQGMTVVSKQGAVQLGSTTFGTTVVSNPTACHAVSGGTSCTFSLAAASPSTDFSISAYDQAPVGGAIPGPAHVVATYQQTGIPIVARQLNTLTFTMGGVVASLTFGNGAIVSAPAQGAVAKTTVSLIPRDAAGEIILTAAGDSSLDRPISVTLAEFGGTGHSYLSTDNGTTHASLPITVADGSTTVTLVYDGGGTPPDPSAPGGAYKSTVTASIAASNDDTTGVSLNNAATKSFDLAPMFLVASALDATNHNGASYAGGSPPTLTFTNILPSSGLAQAQLNVVSAEAASSSSYTSGLTSGACSGVTFSQTGAALGAGSPVSIAFTPVLGSNPTTSSCMFGVSDGAGSRLTVNAVYSPTSATGGVVIPNAPVLAGTVTTLAGGTQGFLDDTGPAAQFYNPQGVAADRIGNVYVADGGNNGVRKVSPSGVVTTLAGGYGVFLRATSVAVDGNGNVYVADPDVYKIRKVTPGGVVTDFAGSTSGYSDGPGATAKFGYPLGVAVDSIGNVYVADAAANLIRKITAAGIVSTIAGTPYYGGDIDGPTDGALLNFPTSVAVDSNGSVYVGEVNSNVVRKISGGVVSTFAACNCGHGFVDGTGSTARFYHPAALAVDARFNLYVADQSNNAIRMITSSGVVTTLAGGTGGYADGTGAAAQFAQPAGVAVDGNGNVYVADSLNQRIRKIQ